MIGQLSIAKALLIDGWMSERELSFLAELAQDCKSIIEIGSYRGRSCRALADNSPDDCKIDCVDSWNYQIYWSNGKIQTVDLTDFGSFYCSLGDHIKKGKVRFHIKSWMDYIPRDRVDFVFIDGDHTSKSVEEDIKKALWVVKPGGIIAGHDYNWKSVSDVVDKFFPKIRLEDTIWMARRKF
jgi:predicted O-methyltransferase YrrM